MGGRGESRVQGKPGIVSGSLLLRAQRDGVVVMWWYVSTLLLRIIGSRPSALEVNRPNVL